MRPTVPALVILLTLGCFHTHAGDPPCNENSVRSAMEKLVRDYQPTEVYYSDGAADGSIVVAGPDYSPHPSVRPVLDCIHVAAPVLIEFLDDPRPTVFLLRTGKNNWVLRQASLGHIALDLLVVTSPETSGIHVPDCNDDGLGACVADGFYFRPDAWEERGRDILVEPEVEAVKTRWLELLASGRLELRLPDWMSTIGEP